MNRDKELSLRQQIGDKAYYKKRLQDDKMTVKILKLLAFILSLTTLIIVVVSILSEQYVFTAIWLSAYIVLVVAGAIEWRIIAKRRPIFINAYHANEIKKDTKSNQNVGDSKNKQINKSNSANKKNSVDNITDKDANNQHVVKDNAEGSNLPNEIGATNGEGSNLPNDIVAPNGEVSNKSSDIIAPKGKINNKSSDIVATNGKINNKSNEIKVIKPKKRR